MAFYNKNNDVWQVTFNTLPKTLEMFSELNEADLKHPYNTVALLVVALCMWPEDQQVAIEMINYLKGPDKLSVREIQFINDRLRGKEYLPYSYFEGSNPENDYIPFKPYTIIVESTPTSFDEDGYAKLYLQSSGADSVRPVMLRQKISTGQWFMVDQMLLSEIRKPSLEDHWS